MLPENIHLSESVTLLFAFLLAATCWDFSTLICSDLKEKAPLGQALEVVQPCGLAHHRFLHRDRNRPFGAACPLSFRSPSP